MGVQASAEYCRCRRGKWSCWLTPSDLAWAALTPAGTRGLAARAQSTCILEGTVAKAMGPPALAGGAGELCILGFHTPPIPLYKVFFFFVSVHSWGLPRQPPLGLPIQNKVSLYLMVMADVRGIWQKQRRGLSLSNISPDVV